MALVTAGFIRKGKLPHGWPERNVLSVEEIYTECCLANRVPKKRWISNKSRNKDSENKGEKQQKDTHRQNSRIVKQTEVTMIGKSYQSRNWSVELPRSWKTRAWVRRALPLKEYLPELWSYNQSICQVIISYSVPDDGAVFVRLSVRPLRSIPGSSIFVLTNKYAA